MPDEKMIWGVRMDNCGISRRDDPADIQMRCKALIGQPVRTVTDVYYHGVAEKFCEEKCHASRAIYEESKQYLPGGIRGGSACHTPFPLCMVRADGAYLYDRDGNRYIDFYQADGAAVLGSDMTAVRETVAALMGGGALTGLPHGAELMLAREIRRHMPGIELFRLFDSGTAALAEALRVARTVTGHRHVLRPGAAGQVGSVRPGDLELLEDAFKRNKITGGTAAILVEPLGSGSGAFPVDRDYNAGVRYLCDRFGALLIFDETVTGFRLAPGGAQSICGVAPDLTVFGSVVAGGFVTAGGVGGKREYAERLSPARAGDKRRICADAAADQFACLAGCAAIREIVRARACEHAGEMGDRLSDGLKALIERCNLPFVAYNQESIVHLECTGTMGYDFASLDPDRSALSLLRHKRQARARREAAERMDKSILANGILAPSGGKFFTSLADTPEIIDDALGRIETVFRHIAVSKK